MQLSLAILCAKKLLVCFSKLSTLSTKSQYDKSLKSNTKDRKKHKKTFIAKKKGYPSIQKRGSHGLNSAELEYNSGIHWNRPVFTTMQNAVLLKTPLKVAESKI